MNARNVMTSIFAAAVMAFAVTAHAQTPSASQQRDIKMAEERFAAADKNGDGKLTLEEAKAGMPRIASSFKKIDTNNDGFVTLAEIKAMIMR